MTVNTFNAIKKPLAIVYTNTKCMNLNHHSLLAALQWFNEDHTFHYLSW